MSGSGGGGSISGASSLSGGLTSRDNSITNANAIDYQNNYNNNSNSSSNKLYNFNHYHQININN